MTLGTISFLFLVGTGAGVVLIYCSFFVYHLITRKEGDEYYAHLLIGTDWEMDGKVPYFGAFQMVSFQILFF